MFEKNLGKGITIISIDNEKGYKACIDMILFYTEVMMRVGFRQN